MKCTRYVPVGAGAESRARKRALCSGNNVSFNDVGDVGVDESGLVDIGGGRASTWSVMAVGRRSCAKPATAVWLGFGARISTAQRRRGQWLTPAFAPTIDQEP
jgi:hypothetical protein